MFHSQTLCCELEEGGIIGHALNIGVSQGCLKYARPCFCVCDDEDDASEADILFVWTYGVLRYLYRT